MPQQKVTSPEVVKTTRSTYSCAWFVVFVTDDYLTRSWCCLEIAVATVCGCKITVVGSCKMIKEKLFYENMVATVESDVQLIKDEIIDLYDSKENFNDIVASAMQVLSVVAQKNTRCELFDAPREKRAGWIERLPSTNPEMKPRDRNADWGIMTGNIASARQDSTSRSLQVFLSSTFTDMVLEWSLILQDLAPYLKTCAHNRGLDLEFCDMRFGNTHEETLSLEIRMDELERCSKESAGTFYLLLTGDKYGPRPVPASIPQAEFDCLLSFMEPEDATLVRSSFLLDENQLDAEKRPAPVYVLQDSAIVSNQVAPEDVVKDSKNVTNKLSRIEQALRGAALVKWADAKSSQLRDSTRYLSLVSHVSLISLSCVFGVTCVTDFVVICVFC